MPETTLTKAAMTQRLMDVAKAMNDHDVDALTSLLTDDVLYRTPALTNPLRGKAAVAEYTRRQFRSMPDLHMPTEDYLVFTGDDPARAVVTWSMAGTMSGPFEGPAAGTNPTLGTVVTSYSRLVSGATPLSATETTLWKMCSRAQP